MNRFAASALCSHLILGAALVFSALLVTLLFSFLGTICLAALVGLMLGSLRRWRWQILPVSLVFPATIMAFFQVSKTDLTAHKCLMVALVCFGTFWIAFVPAVVLLSLERPAGTPERETPPSGSPAPPAAPAWEPGPAELQGRWTRESTAPDGAAYRSVVEIADESIAISLVGLDGQPRVLAKGGVRLEASRRHPEAPGA